MMAIDKLLNTALGKHFRILCGYSALLLIISATMIYKAKAIYISVWTHDNFTYLDGAYRILKGQIPHIDFITPIGLLGYLLPFLGLKITGSYALALPAADLIVASVAIILTNMVAYKRLSMIPALMLITYVWLLTSVPVNIGDASRYVSYSMFYNRHGWAFILILFVLYVRQDDSRRETIINDIIAGSIILIYLFYTKISFAAVSIAFMVILALKSKYHLKLAIMCFLGLLSGILLVESVLPGLNKGYAQDLLTAVQSSGAIRGGMYTVVNFIYRNITGILLTALVIVLSARVKPMAWHDYVFVAYVFLSAYALLNQNAQTRNMVTLFAISVWAMQATQTKLAGMLKDGNSHGLETVKAIALGVLALSILLAAQPFATRLYAMVIISARSKPMAASKAIDLDKLRKIYVYKDEDYISGIDKDNYSNKEIYVLRNRMRRDWLAEQEYVETVLAGVKLLRMHANSTDSIIALDMVNPFNFLLDTVPPKNSYSFLHINRTFNLGAAKPKLSMLDHASLVMIPNYPIQMPERDALLEVFGPALKGKFKEVGRDRYWTLLRKKDKDHAQPNLTD
jgi:hypothetical protein